MGGRVKDEETASRNAAEHTPQTGPRAEMSAALAGVGLVATVGVPVFINYWIVRIRWEYMEAFPEAAKPPTISRAMSDIPLGAQMGTWLSICAVLMVIGDRVAALRPHGARPALFRTAAAAAGLDGAGDRGDPGAGFDRHGRAGGLFAVGQQ
jgi:hypothetical protein